MKRRQRAVVCVEQLETRALLAGNMTGDLIGDTYHLIGDAEDNAIAIYTDGDDFVIRGLNNTTVSGQEIVRVPRTSIDDVDSFFARGGAGDDHMLIDFTGLTWDGEANIGGGGGNDALVVHGSTVAQFARVAGGSGHDYLAVRGINVLGDARVDAGNGSDTVVMNDFTIGDDYPFIGGGGRDFLWLEGGDIADNTSYKLSTRADWLVASDMTVGGNMTVDGQRGDDTFVNDIATNTVSGTLTARSIGTTFNSLGDWSGANPPEATFVASDNRLEALFTLIDTAVAPLPTAVQDTLEGVFGDTIPTLFFT